VPVVIWSIRHGAKTDLPIRGLVSGMLYRNHCSIY
jgi:hypothetical protein